MELYRVCKEDELDNLFNDIDTSNIGRYCYPSCVNTHMYDLNKKYLHFFTKFSDIFYLNLRKGYYICEYNIPDNILEGRFGTGRYTDLIKFKSCIDVEECILENNEINFDYLVKVYKIKEKMDIEDLIFDNVDNKIRLIYRRKGNKKYEKTLR